MCWHVGHDSEADLDTALRLHPAAVAISGRRLAATLAYADLAIGLGRCEQAVEYLHPVVADEPLHEGLHARLMLALAGCGQRAAALAAYAELRSRLADDLGVEPGRELQQAHVRVLRHDVSSSRPPAAGSVDHPNGRVAPAQLPASAPGFTGRAEHIAELDALLEAATDRRRGRGGRGDGDGRPTGVSVTAIAGTAGVGKTALALHWAHRVADRFPHGQLYLNLRGFDASDAAMTPAEALPGFLDALGVPPERIPTTVDGQSGLFRSLLADRRMLILLDNAYDAEQVRPLLPGAPGCFTLVTSRNHLSGLVATGGAHPLTLNPLLPAEARELLAARLGRQRMVSEPDAVDEIATRCAGLPLALAIVAARAATHPTFPLAAIAGELHDASGSLDGLGAAEPASDIRAVFSWSLRKLSAGAARLFRHLGLHPGPDITAPAAVSLAGIPPRRARRLILDELGHPGADDVRARLGHPVRPGVSVAAARNPR